MWVGWAWVAWPSGGPLVAFPGVGGALGPALVGETGRRCGGFAPGGGGRGRFLLVVGVGLCLFLFVLVGVGAGLGVFGAFLVRGGLFGLVGGVGFCGIWRGGFMGQRSEHFPFTVFLCLMCAVPLSPLLAGPFPFFRRSLEGEVEIDAAWTFPTRLIVLPLRLPLEETQLNNSSPACQSSLQHKRRVNSLIVFPLCRPFSSDDFCGTWALSRVSWWSAATLEAFSRFLFAPPPSPPHPTTA